jgi:ATP-dependent DNA helicase RecG
MVKTNNGFEIAEIDLQLRGPGDLQGTQQSGVLDLHIADLAKDQKILQEARITAQEIVDNDPYLQHPYYTDLRKYMASQSKSREAWGRIS